MLSPSGNNQSAIVRTELDGTGFSGRLLGLIIALEISKVLSSFHPVCSFTLTENDSLRRKLLSPGTRDFHLREALRRWLIFGRQAYRC